MFWGALGGVLGVFFCFFSKRFFFKFLGAQEGGLGGLFLFFSKKNFFLSFGGPQGGLWSLFLFFSKKILSKVILANCYFFLLAICWAEHFIFN